MLQIAQSITPSLIPQNVPMTPPHVRGQGCSIELTCDFVFDGTEITMIEGTRDVVYIARVN